MGPPGCGKGTQAELLAKKLGVLVISTGVIIRNLMESGGFSKEQEENMNKGGFLPDEQVIKIVEDEISKKEHSRGFVLDGFPRSLFQAESFEDFEILDCAIYYSVSDSEVVKRISGRRQCHCGSTYHVLFNPPKKEGFCDDCNEKLYQREDDGESVVKNRLLAYQEKTQPLIEFYKSKGILLEIDGEQKIEKVFEDTIEALKL